mgnify:CR=1 FL=1
MTRRLVLPVFLLALCISAIAQQTDQDRAQFGRNITVEPGQSSGDIACFNCSVYVRGTVKGDVAVFGGRLAVDGAVQGDVAVFWGDARLAEGSSVGGDMAVLGGRIIRAPTAVIRGETARLGRGWIFIPLIFAILVIGAIMAFIVWLVTRSRPAGPVGAPGPSAGRA